MTHTDTDARTEYERDISEAMSRAPGRRRFVKSAERRTDVVHMLRNAYATVIADDVVNGTTPWHRTVAKYRLAMAEVDRET